MPTVLDSLVLEFNLDTSQFTREQQRLMDSLRKMEEQSRKHAINIEDQVKKMGNVFSNLQRGALGVIGAFVGADVYKAMDNFSKLEQTAERMGKRMNLSAQEVQGFTNMFHQFGFDVQAGNQALESLNRTVRQLQTQGGNAPLLGIMGIAGVTDRNLNPIEMYMQIVQGLQQRVPEGPNKAGVIQSLLERGGFSPEMAILGSTENIGRIRQVLKEQTKAAYVSPEQIKSADELQQAMRKAETATNNLGKAITTLASGPMTWAINQFAKMTDKFTELFTRWGIKPNTPEDVAQKTALETGLREKFGAPREALNMASGMWDYLTGGVFRGGPLDFGTQAGEDLYGPGGKWPGQGEPPTAAQREKAKAAREYLNKVFSGDIHPGSVPYAGGGDLGTNWNRFLNGLSYLETDQQNVGNTRSSAQGYFQFLSGTAQLSQGMGIGDPRFGSYGSQASMTKEFIRRKYPAAADAIEKGDYATATRLLGGEWPSLPGGSQQQSPSRYRQFESILHGGSVPGGGLGPQSSLTINVNGVTINDSSGNADHVASNISTAIKRSLTAVKGNTALG